jgi:hypothetical protein
MVKNLKDLNFALNQRFAFFDFNLSLFGLIFAPVFGVKLIHHFKIVFNSNSHHTFLYRLLVPQTPSLILATKQFNHSLESINCEHKLISTHFHVITVIMRVINNHLAILSKYRSLSPTEVQEKFYLLNKLTKVNTRYMRIKL